MCGELRVERISIHYFSGYPQNQRTSGALNRTRLTNHNFLTLGDIDIGGYSSVPIVESTSTIRERHINPQFQVVVSNHPISLTAIHTHARVLERIGNFGAYGYARVQWGHESTGVTLLGIP